jgi:hypothetical protein
MLMTAGGAAANDVVLSTTFNVLEERIGRLHIDYLEAIVAGLR